MFELGQIVSVALIVILMKQVWEWPTFDKKGDKEGPA